MSTRCATKEGAAMGITDELREWMRVVLTDDDPAHAIADRIDAEHERITHNLADALHKQEEATRELDEKSVLLPVDANGEYIHIGDVMEFIYDPPQDQPLFEVSGIGADGTLFYAPRGEVFPRKSTKASVVRHYHKPTVEDVLREFGDWYAHTKGGCDEDGIIAEYAAKLMLKED